VSEELQCHCRFFCLTLTSIIMFVFSLLSGSVSGEFSSGGRIAVECSPFLVAEVDTKGRFGKVDGRFPHWVTPYEGERFSLIYVSAVFFSHFYVMNEDKSNGSHTFNQLILNLAHTVVRHIWQR